MPSAGDQPGWAPDPERPGMLRWWNGLGWSDARKAPDEATDRFRAAAQQAVRSSTVTPQQVARTTATRRLEQTVPSAAENLQRSAPEVARRIGRAAPAAGTAAAGTLNPFAPGALTVGVLGILFGLGGVLSVIGVLLSIAGVVRSRVLARRGQRKTGLGPSLAGLVLSGFGLARDLALLGQLPDLITGFLNS